MAISPKPRWPVGLIGMLAVVVGVEVGVGQRERQLTATFAVEWNEANRAVRIAQGSAVVAMGDSLVKNGVLPAVIEPRLGPGRTMYNVAISGGPTPVSYFLLRRLVESGHAPDAVLVDGQILTSSPRTPPHPLPWHALLWFRELAELAWSFGDPGFFAENAGRKLIPSLRHRVTIRAILTAAFTGKPFDDPRHFWLFIANWNRNKGCLLLADRARTLIAKEQPYDHAMVKRFAGEWKCDRWQGEYAERFLALAAAHHVRVYWLMMPDDPAINAVREHDGWWRGHADYLRSLQSRHPNLFVIDGHRADYPPESLADVLHLSRTGAIAFSDALGMILADAAPKRWIALPRYDPARARLLAARSPAMDLERHAHTVAAIAGNAKGTVRR